MLRRAIHLAVLVLAQLWRSDTWDRQILGEDLATWNVQKAKGVANDLMKKETTGKLV